MDLIRLSDSDDCGYSSDTTMHKYVSMESTPCTFDYKENVQTSPKNSSKFSNSGEDRERFPMLSNRDNENNILKNCFDFTNNVVIGENQAKLDSSKSSFKRESSDTSSTNLWKPYLKRKHENSKEDHSSNSENTRTKNFMKPFNKRSFLQLFNNEASENNIEVSSSKFNPDACLMCGTIDFIDDIDNHLLFGTVSCKHCAMNVSTCDDFHKIVTNNHGCLNHVLVFSYNKLDSFINENDLINCIDYLRTYLKVTRSVCNNRQFISSYSYFKSRLLFLEKGNKIEPMSSSVSRSAGTNGGIASSSIEKKKDGYQQKIVLHKIKGKEDSHQINQWVIKETQSKMMGSSNPSKLNYVFVHRFSEDCPQCYQTFDIKTFSICIKSYIASLYCNHCNLTVAFNSQKLTY